MREDDLRDLVSEEVARLGGHLSWIESHVTSAGFPDADICIAGAVIQVELKVSRPNGDIGIRPTQYKWFKDRIAAGGRPIVIAGVGDAIYLVEGNTLSNASPLQGSTRLKHTCQLSDSKGCTKFDTVGQLLEAVIDRSKE